MLFPALKVFKKHVVTWFTGDHGGDGGVIVGLDVKNVFLY